jgi:hypothetical protein
MRRESDAVKARLQRWIELADRALRSRDNSALKQSQSEDLARKME